MGAHVAIVEVDPVRALEALMDGFQVMTAADAAPWGELFVTATGNINVFRREHFAAMRDGAIMANSGHFDAELDLKALREMAEGHVRDARENVQEFDLGGKRVNLIAEGRLVNTWFFPRTRCTRRSSWGRSSPDSSRCSRQSVRRT